MEPAAILEVLCGNGFAVLLGAGNRLLVSPASKLHESQRELLRANKAELVAFLKEADHVAARELTELLEVAMRVCDFHGDGPAFREEMRADCVATPPHLRAELLDYFRQAYGAHLRCGGTSRTGKGGDP